MLQIFAYYAPIMLFKTRYNCTAKPVLSSWLNTLSSIRLAPRNKLLIIDIWTVLLEYIHNCLSVLTVLLEYIDSHTQGECSIRVYRSNICLLCWHYASIIELPIMPWHNRRKPSGQVSISDSDTTGGCCPFGGSYRPHAQIVKSKNQQII